MASPSLQQSFNAGEISPELYGEVSLNKLSSAATTMRNMCVSYRGGAFSRGGLAFVGRSKQTPPAAPPRLITFQFSITQGYELEFGDNYVRFIFQGGYVLEDPITILGVVNNDPCLINVAGTPFSNDDWVFISGISGTTELNGNTYIVSGVASGSFTLKDLNGFPVDASGFGIYDTGGTVSRLYTIDSPYAAVDLPYLKVAQSADTMFLTLSNPQTGTEYPPQSLVRFAATNWTLTATDFGAQIAAPTNIAVRAQSSQNVSTFYAYAVTAIDAKTGEESPASDVGTVENNDISVYSGSNIITWNAVEGAGSYNVYKALPSYGDPVPVGAIFGLMAEGVLGTSAADTNITPDFQQSPPLHADPFARGQILDILPNVPGTDYSQTTIGYTLGSTGSGSGFTGTPLSNAGGFAGFYIVNPGHDYPPGVTVALTDSGGGLATGWFRLPTVIPTDGDEAFFNSVKVIFKDPPVLNGSIDSDAHAMRIENGSTIPLTIANLASALSASPSLNLTCADYIANSLAGVATDGYLTITYKTPGDAGNHYKIDVSSSHGTSSGGTLTGGGDVGSGATGTVTVGPQTGTYPGVTALFQQRQFYANSFNNPDTFWASRTGAFKNFDTSIPTSPSDAITATPWSEQVNGIQWLMPMPGGLIAMTGNRAWQIVGEGSYALNVQPITPSSTQAQPQAFNGCSATLPPVIIDYDVIYREAVNNVVRDLSWNFFSNIYTGNDLTVLASHLFLNSDIVQWAWARSPYKILWACRSDGTMLSLTYLKEQEVFGWARHDTQGFVLDLASVTEPPVNAVYAVVRRFPPYAARNGVYTIERMDNRLWQSVEDAYAVDSAVSNPMAFPNTTLSANSTSGAVVFTAGAIGAFNDPNGTIVRMGGGIARITPAGGVTAHGTWILSPSNSAVGHPFAVAGTWSVSEEIDTLQAAHLARCTNLVGLLDGLPVSGLVADTLGNIALPFTASDVKVGFDFAAQLQTPYLNDPRIQGQRKVISSAVIRLNASGSGFQVGTNQPDGAAQNPPQLAPAWSNMATKDTANPGSVQPGAPTYVNPAGQTVTQLWTGDQQITVAGDWLKPGQVAVQQTLPLALEVTAIMPDVLPGDVPEIAYQQKPQDGGAQQSAPRGPGRWMLQGGRL